MLRVLCVIRAVYGMALLLAPRRALTSLDVNGARAAVRVVRLLGARHLIQAGLTAAGGSARTCRYGAAVDGVHALSAIALGRACLRLRRVAALDAGIATMWAVVGVAAARRAR